MSTNGHFWFNADFPDREHYFAACKGATSYDLIAKVASVQPPPSPPPPPGSPPPYPPPPPPPPPPYPP
ncbi:MAG: hypothetical protein U0871_20835 [Gemmataceae bacterium]